MYKKIFCLGLLTLPVISTASDTFDATTGQLSMPSVLVGSDCYQVTMQYQGELAFTISSAELKQQKIESSNSITVEPDDSSVNSDVSTSVSSAALSTTGTDNLPSPVYSVESPGQAATGTQVFGYDNGSFGGQWYTPERVLRIDFTTPTNLVSVGVRGFDSVDFGKMEIYDSANALLDTIESARLEGGVADTISTGVRSIADVSYALVFGTSISDTIGIDNLQFNKVTLGCNE